jgi:hypothetical protein
MGSLTKVIVVLSLIFGLAGCSVRKKAVSFSGPVASKEPAALEETMKENAFEFEFFSAKSKTSFRGMGISQDFTLHIRMQRDKKIWLSAQALLGIEVARVLITEDSVFLLQNFPERNYKALGISEISGISSVTLTLREIQDVFLGNPLGSYKNVLIGLQNDSIVVEKRISDFILREFIHPDMARIARVNLQSIQDPSAADIVYSDYKPQGNKSLPKKVNIFVRSQELEASCELNYYDISTDPVTSFPFRVPQGY